MELSKKSTKVYARTIAALLICALFFGCSNVLGTVKKIKEKKERKLESTSLGSQYWLRRLSPDVFLDLAHAIFPNSGGNESPAQITNHPPNNRSLIVPLKGNGA